MPHVNQRVRLISLVTGDSSAALLVRRLLPATLGIPLLVGSLRLLGEDVGLYSTHVGVVIMTASTMIGATALLLWTARSLERVDRKRRRAEEDVRRSRAQHRALARNFPDGAIVLFDREL